MSADETFSVQSRLHKLLALPIRSPEHLQLLEEFHIPRRRGDLLDLLLLSLIRTALSGSVPAFKEILEIADFDSSLLLYQHLDRVLDKLPAPLHDPHHGQHT